MNLFKKSKEGFTLVELLGAIVILALLSLVAIPSVTKTVKSNKQKLYDIQKKNIEAGAKAWGSENLSSLPIDGNCITITLKDLKKSGFVENDISNPKDGSLIPDDSTIAITNENNGYNYNFNGTCNYKTYSLGERYYYDTTNKKFVKSSSYGYYYIIGGNDLKSSALKLVNIDTSVNQNNHNLLPEEILNYKIKNDNFDYPSTGLTKSDIEDNLLQKLNKVDATTFVGILYNATNFSGGVSVGVPNSTNCIISKEYDLDDKVYVLRIDDTVSIESFTVDTLNCYYLETILVPKSDIGS